MDQIILEFKLQRTAELERSPTHTLFRGSLSKFNWRKQNSACLIFLIFFFFYFYLQGELGANGRARHECGQIWRQVYYIHVRRQLYGVRKAQICSLALVTSVARFGARRTVATETG